MAVLKRSEWNALIEQVNQVAQNPPDGCDPLSPLLLVDPNHIWTKADIQAVRNKILEMECSEISFSAMPELWKQKTIDEINEQLEKAWCDCEGCPCVFAPCQYAQPFSEVFLMNAECDFNCTPGDPGNGRMDWSPRVHGLQVGLSGFVGRTYRVFRFNPNSGEKAFITPFGTGTSGIIDCEGKIVSQRDTSGTKGMIVFRPSGIPHQLWARLACGPVSGVPTQCRDCDHDPVNCFPPGWPVDFLPGQTTLMIGCCD